MIARAVLRFRHSAKPKTGGQSRFDKLKALSLVEGLVRRREGALRRGREFPHLYGNSALHWQSRLPRHRSLVSANQLCHQFAQDNAFIQLAGDKLHIRIEAGLEHSSEFLGLVPVDVRGGDSQGEGVDRPVFFAGKVLDGCGWEAIEGAAEEKGLPGSLEPMALHEVLGNHQAACHGNDGCQKNPNG